MAYPRLARAVRDPLPPTSYSLAATHVRVYGECVESEARCCTVFEDDAHLVPRMRVVAESLQLPADFDFVKLEYCHGLGYSSLARAPPRGVGIQIKEGTGGACSAAVVVSRRGAMLLREANTPVWAHSDMILEAFYLKVAGVRAAKGFHAVPPLVVQNKSLLVSNPEGSRTRRAADPASAAAFSRLDQRLNVSASRKAVFACIDRANARLKGAGTARPAHGRNRSFDECASLLPDPNATFAVKSPSKV